MKRLGNRKVKNTGQFYARADNLRQYLEVVEKRLGGLSARLSASTERLERSDALTQRNISANQTPWLEIDDIFYETRGSTWALIHFLKAMEVDFHDVLSKKNALISFRQIIRELESTQDPLRAPMVLNGAKFGAFANHSLVMANYISRANAAIMDLRYLLQEG